MTEKQQRRVFDLLSYINGLIIIKDFNCNLKKSMMNCKYGLADEKDEKTIIYELSKIEEELDNLYCSDNLDYFEENDRQLFIKYSDSIRCII